MADQGEVSHSSFYDEIKSLQLNSLHNTHNFFNKEFENNTPYLPESLQLRLSMKINDEYKRVHRKLDKNIAGGNILSAAGQSENLTKEIADLSYNIQHIYTSTKQPQQQKQKAQKEQPKSDHIDIEEEQYEPPTKGKPTLNPNFQAKSDIEKAIEQIPQPQPERLSKIPAHFLKNKKPQNVESNETQLALPTTSGIIPYEANRTGALVYHRATKLVKPVWHRPWKLMRVISGHQGWVRCIAVDPSNQFFVTGSTDRTIKFWDLASGQLKISFTGHINTIRGLALSKRHAYLYSCAEDKTVKCWDLEYNKIVRNYHGHLSGVYCLSLHPTLDVLATAGRDSVIRLWDVRTRAQVHVLEGHKHAISSLISQEFEPQLVSGSHDNMVRLWDIGTGKCINTLTNHKKAVRSLVFHHEEYTFLSASADNMKVWKCPEGEFLRNVSGHNAIINDVALNSDNVLVSCADNGSMQFWDWKSGYNFQTIQSKVQPGSISSENGIFCAEFDQSSLRLITGECDKTIKVYKEDEEATEETHPIDLNWRPDMDNQRY